jgi:hypothetical protein
MKSADEDIRSVKNILKFLALPLLAVAFPILFMYGQNAWALTPGSLTFPMVASLLVTAVVFALLLLVQRRVFRVPLDLAPVPTAALALLLLAPLPAGAQVSRYEISQRATVAQNLGPARVSVDYARPLARGRPDIFGKTVIWGELWTPGANTASILDVTKEVQLNGKKVPAGRWSMWVIPSQVGPWELVLDPRDSLFHTNRPEPSDSQIVVPLRARLDAPHTEALAWTFPRIDHDGGTLQLNWLNFEIPLEIKVESLRPKATVAAEEAALYAGEWIVAFEPDTARPMTPPPTALTVRHLENGLLEAAYPPAAFGGPPPAKEEPKVDLAKLSPQEREREEAKRKLATFEQTNIEFVLVPRAKGVFTVGWAENGELLEVYDFFHEFEFENGRAVKVILRGEDDKVFATGKRK